MTIDPATETVIAVMCAVCEQLDIERLLVALHRQHDSYAARPEAGAIEVAALIRQIGAAVAQIQELRELRTAPSH